MATSTREIAAAKGLMRLLNSKTEGLWTDEIHLDMTGEHPVIVWEGGPFEWAICWSLGESLFNAELERSDEDTSALALADKHGVMLEPTYSFALGIYEL